MSTVKRIGVVLLWMGLFVPFASCQSVPRGPGSVTGSWEGKLVAGQVSLRIWLSVAAAPSGALKATLISLDQGATPIPCTDVTLKGATFSFQVPAVQGSYTGRLSSDGTTIAGTWTQGQSLPLTLDRQPKGARPQVAAGVKPQPARPPVRVDKLKAVLDGEFAPLVGGKTLEASAGVGVVVGVLQKGQRRVFAYGAAEPDSIFEIGSVTKTFTGLLLAQMVEQHHVTLDQPLRELLPPGTVAKPAGPQITLLDLATQHSGLPRLPTNFEATADPANPYAGYHAAQLLAYLAKRGVALPPKAGYLYSNLGYGLLGFLLARRAGVSYGRLVAREITGPLHMPDTSVQLSPSQHRRLVRGHDAASAAVPPWTFDALAGAGALHATAGDLLTYLQAQLHPASADPGAAAQGPGATLADAIAMTHQLRANGPAGMKVGMGWLYEENDGTYWHNGATGGFTSFVAFQPASDRGVVVLYNREDAGARATAFTQRVAANVLALLAGAPATPLQ